MTIVGSVKVRDGLILGTDSMTQVSLGQQVVKAYSNARKLFQIRDEPIGVMTYGLGNIGQRSVEGIVFDFCQTPASQCSSVAELAAALASFSHGLYETQYNDVPLDQRPELGFFVAGYTSGQPFPEEHEFLFPNTPQPIPARAPEQFGASWRGVGQPFTRLYKGADPAIYERLKGLGLTDTQITNDVLGGLEMAVAYDGMPVQDAINFAVLILQTTVGWATFQLGSPVCGGPLQLAAVLPDDGFQWIAKPELRISS